MSRRSAGRLVLRQATVLFCVLGLLALVAGTQIEFLQQTSPETAVPGGGLVPDQDAPPVTAALGTSLYHAQTCAQYLGPIPAMNCADAFDIPITIDGDPVDGWPDSCDRPSALTGDCQPAKVNRYPGMHHDGSPRPEVVFMTFCRDGGLGAIGHNSETGATCFFQSNGSGTRLHPGSKDPDYDVYWDPPDIVAADNCQGCHQADPWLHSPWIDQVKDLSDPNEPLVPLTATATSPYIVIGEDFTQPIHNGAPKNRCTSCHRAQCSQFSMDLTLLPMPAPFDAYTESDLHADDRIEVKAWCDVVDPRGLNVAAAVQPVLPPSADQLVLVGRAK